MKWTGEVLAVVRSNQYTLYTNTLIPKLFEAWDANLSGDTLIGSGATGLSPDPKKGSIVCAS